MGRLLVLGLIAVCVGTAFAGDAKRPASQDELVALVPGAIGAKNAAPLLATVEDITSHCDVGDDLSELKKDVEQYHAKSKAAAEACAKVGDWSAAKQLSVEAKGKGPKPAKGCRDTKRYGDVRVAYQLGEQTVHVNLDDPLMFGNELFVAKRLRCSAEQGK